MSNYAIQYQLQAKDALTPALRKALAMLKKIDQTAKKFNKPVKFNLNTQLATQRIQKLSAMANARLAKPTRFNIDTKIAHQKIKQLETHARTAMAKTNAIGAGGAAVAARGVGRGRGSIDMMQGAIGATAGYMFLKSAIDKGMEFQKVLVDTEKFSDKSGAALESYKNMMLEVSNATGQSAVDVGLITNEFIKLDESFGEAELKRMTMMANQVSMAWDNVDPQTAGEALAVIKSQWGLSIDELEKYANKIDYVSDKISNVDSDYLMNAIKDNSGMAKANNIGFDQMTSFFAAADASKADLSKAGGAFKLFMSGMRDKGNDKTFEKIGLGKNFSAKAIDPNTASKAMQDAMFALNKYKGNDKPELVADIVGKNYNDTMLQILTMGDRFDESMSRLGETQNIDGRMAEGQKKYLDSAVGKLGVLKAKYDNLFISLFGNSKRLGKIFDVIGSGLDFIGRNPAIVEMGIALSVAAVAAGALAIGIMAISSPIAVMVAGIAAGILVMQQAYENSEALRGAMANFGGTAEETGGAAIFIADAFHVANMAVTFFGIGLSTIITSLDIVLTYIEALAIGIYRFSTMDFSGVGEIASQAGDDIAAKFNRLASNVSADVSRLEKAKAELDNVKAQADQARGMAGIGASISLSPQPSKSAEAANAQKAAADVSVQASQKQVMAGDTQIKASNEQMNAARALVNAALKIDGAAAKLGAAGAGLGDQAR